MSRRFQMDTDSATCTSQKLTEPMQFGCRTTRSCLDSALSVSRSQLHTAQSYSRQKKKRKKTSTLVGVITGARVPRSSPRARQQGIAALTSANIVMVPDLGCLPFGLSGVQQARYTEPEQLSPCCLPQRATACSAWSGSQREFEGVECGGRCLQVGCCQGRAPTP